jgi:hypothetical protein
MQRLEAGQSRRGPSEAWFTAAVSGSRRPRRSLVALGLLAAALMASASAAQEATKTVNLWPGVAPGSEQWKQPEATLRPGMIVNVTTPTLTVYSPAPSAATGTAVIIAPGGGFVGLSIDSEVTTSRSGSWLEASPPSS